MPADSARLNAAPFGRSGGRRLAASGRGSERAIFCRLHAPLIFGWISVEYGVATARPGHCLRGRERFLSGSRRLETPDACQRPFPWLV